MHFFDNNLFFAEKKKKTIRNLFSVPPCCIVNKEDIFGKSPLSILLFSRAFTGAVLNCKRRPFFFRIRQRDCGLQNDL